MADVTKETIRSALQDLGLSAHPVCLHSSLRSFGRVVGGASTILEGSLAEECTLMVPTYSYWAWTTAPEQPEFRPDRNAYDYNLSREPATRPYSPDSHEVSPEMGAVAAAVCLRSDRLRGSNPGVSFSAIGPLAIDLIASQKSHDPHAPFRALAALGGFVVLAGVSLERMSLLHAAEELAGRVPFMRYAFTKDGVVPFATGGCSEGLGNLASVLEPVRKEAVVGESRLQVFPAADALRVATAAIKDRPSITPCDDPECSRCEAAIAGGPILATSWSRFQGNADASASS